jgi:hypothetical protein
MPLTPEVNAIIRELSEPLAPGDRPAFQRAMEQKLEAAPVVGPGTPHQIGRIVQRDFRDPPDLRQGRVVLKT